MLAIVAVRFVAVGPQRTDVEVWKVTICTCRSHDDPVAAPIVTACKCAVVDGTEVVRVDGNHLVVAISVLNRDGVGRSSEQRLTWASDFQESV